MTRPEFQIHGLVEFSNRVLTVIVGMLVLALPVLAMLLQRSVTSRRLGRRTDLVLLGFGLWLGYLAQAVLGGLTVLFHLHPALVAGHFLVSMALLLDAVVLDIRARREQVPLAPARLELRLLAWAVTAVAGAVLVIGTVVTGSGPHSGDSTDVRRFGFDVRSVAQLHADAAMLLTGLVVATLLAARLVRVPGEARRSADWLVLAVLGQVALGFTQYFLHIPAGLVGLHLAGATVVWIFALRFQLLLPAAVPTEPEPATPAPRPEKRAEPIGA